MFMKNNYGFGKFETLTIIVLLMALFAFLAYTFLGGTSSHKLEAMKESASSFSKTVTTNISTFHYTNKVYLGEAVDEQLIKNIKSPVSKGYCSVSASYVELIDGYPYTTMQCGNILIEKANFADKNVPMYQVGDWVDKKENSDDEEMTFYNCTDNGKEVFDEYFEELYFVYQVNKKYGTNYFFASRVTQCEVVEKTMYRTKKLLEN